MTTHADRQNADIIDWQQLLNDPTADKEYIEEHAENWHSCPVGQLDERIKRGMTGKPFDSQLYKLGADFAAYVAKGRYRYASQLLVLIEQRGNEIKS